MRRQLNEISSLRRDGVSEGPEYLDISLNEESIQYFNELSAKLEIEMAQHAGGAGGAGR